MSMLNQTTIALMRFINLITTSRTDLVGLANLGGISVGVSRYLHLLAKLSDGHGLPAADLLHFGKELLCGQGSVHIGSDVGVVHGALLEDADAVVVGTDGVVGVVERLGDVLVGVDEDVGLHGGVSGDFVRLRKWARLCGTYLDNSGSNTGLAAVTAELFLLRLGNDGLSVLSLDRVQAGQVAAAAAAAAAAATALARDVAVFARLHVVVGDVAAIGCLVPDVVAEHVGAGGLAGDLDVVALRVGLDDLVAGAWAGAAVHGGTGDGVRTDGGYEGKGKE